MEDHTRQYKEHQIQQIRKRDGNRRQVIFDIQRNFRDKLGIITKIGIVLTTLKLKGGIRQQGR